MNNYILLIIQIKGLPSEGKEVSRPYTPTSLNSQKGTFELVIKSYPAGNVSSYLHSLKVGDKIEVKGPFPKIKYTPNMKKSIGMIAGNSVFFITVELGTSYVSVLVFD